ncbi:hypothetical protein PAMP_021416 [Pampus punctatissimus]
MSLPQQLRDESDFDQLPDNIPISATIADTEEKKGFIDYYMFVIEVKTKGGSKYLIYRRYREFFNLHQILESRYSPEDPERPGPNTCILPSIPGKVFIGNKKEIAESRIPELNTYMKEDSQTQYGPLLLPQGRGVYIQYVYFTWCYIELHHHQAMFDFRGNSKAELNLKRGEVIFLLRRVNTDWLETGIFPESFVKIIKPLPESDSESEGGGHTYSCLRCYLLTPSGVETRDVCVQEDLTIEPTYKDLISRMRGVFKVDDIAVNYRDPEGDLIRILDNEDVQLMIRESRGQQRAVKRPVNQFPWELHVSMASDFSVYNNEA